MTRKGFKQVIVPEEGFPQIPSKTSAKKWAGKRGEGQAEVLRPLPELENFWAAQRALKPPKLSDEELLKVVLREARRDYFQGRGRVFLDEFMRYWDSTPDRIINVLKANGFKWDWSSDRVLFIML